MGTYFSTWGGVNSLQETVKLILRGENYFNTASLDFNNLINDNI